MGILKLQRTLIILGFLVVPLLSFGEISALFSGALSDQTSSISGLIKFTKDIIFALLILLGFSYYLIKAKVSRKPLIIFLFSVILIIPSILLSATADPLMLLSGLRWFLPFFLVFFIYEAINKNFIDKLARVLLLLFFLHLIAQVLQAFFASSWYGVSYFGLNARNPGLFLIPNTGAFFSLMLTYFFLFLSDFSAKTKLLLIPLCFLSILLTLSGTGFLLFFFVVFFYLFSYRNLVLLPAILVAALPVFFYGLNLFLSRGDSYIEESGGTRLSIFIDVMNSVGLFSENFGLGTNSYVLLGGDMIMDSLYASLLMNIGYFGFLIFVFTFFIALLFAIYSSDKKLFTFLLFMASYAATTILFEAYPMNLMTIVISICFLKQQQGKLN